MSIPKRKWSTSIILSLLAIELLILVFLPQYEALATKSENKEERDKGKNNKKNKMTVKRLQGITNSLRTYQGQQTTVPSMLMLMESSPYYLWEYYSTGLIMSDTCVLLRAYDLANTWNDPPTLYTDYSHTLYIPRYGCDVNHHIRDVYFNTPAYDWTTQYNDISLATTKQKIQFGNNVCGSQPVAPTWVSCDPTGPPVDYTDCYWASYGLTNYTDNWYVAAPEEINPNADQVKILSKEACDELRDRHGEYITMDPDTQICGSTVNGDNPYCPYDYNGALFCKYWGNTGWGSNGWGSNGNGWNTPPSGWNGPPPSGWNGPPPSGWNGPPPSGWNAPPPTGWNAPPPTGWSDPATPDLGAAPSDSPSGWSSPPSGWTGTDSPPSGWSSPPSGWTGTDSPPSGWSNPPTGWTGSASSPPSGWSNSGWGSPPPSGWNSNYVANPGGWPALGWPSKKGQSSKNKGDKREDRGNYVAVGHMVWYYGGSCPDITGSIFIKYGSTTYRDLFASKDCEFTCSSDLPSGYRCQGNPDPSLGPVYCKPESIPGGWKRH